MIELRDIHKRFGRATALDGVSLQLSRDEIHAVLGENGAGKSTLMKILNGLLQPDAGEIRVDGRAQRIANPDRARALGLAMVHQHFTLVDRLNVARNVRLADRHGPFWLTRKTLDDHTRDVARRTRLEIEPRSVVADLSVGLRQRVELLKVLQSPPRLLILDEPTAVLTPTEVDALFETIRRLHASGCGIVFISHKLDEVLRLCDRITILRRGRTVWTGRAADVSAPELARHMVGADSPARSASPLPHRREQADAPRAWVELASVSSRGHALGPGLSSVSLQVTPGEIVGIAGVDGNGQSALVNVIMQFERPAVGTVTLRAARIGFVPDDRHREGLVLPMSVYENTVLAPQATRPFCSWGMVHWGAVRRQAERLLLRFDVRAASVRVPVSSLSGGNQQKLILARELSGAPDLIVAVNPTRGLDAAATAFSHRQFCEAASRGAGVLLVSSDLAELTGLCQRILALSRGRLSDCDWPRAGLLGIARQMTSA